MEKPTGRPLIKARRRWANALYVVDLGASLLFGGGAIWLASVGAAPSAFFLASVWAWLAGTLAGAVAGDMLLGRFNDFERRLWARFPRRLTHRILGIVSLAILSALLFAVGETVIAIASELLFFMRLAEARGEFDPLWNKRRHSSGSGGQPWWSVGYEYLFMPVGVIWVAYGAPPAWMEALIIYGLWILSGRSIFGVLMEAGVSTFSGMRLRHPDVRFRAMFPGKEIPRAPEDYPAEPKSHWFVRVARWPYRVGVVAAAAVLWFNGWPELALVYPASALCAIAGGVAWRRKEYGPLVEVDATARLINAVLWPPMKVIGAVSTVGQGVLMIVIFSPFLLVFYFLHDRLVPFRRGERERRALLKEAADGANLCRAFERPEGFIYFLYSSRRQYEHFMAADGVLRLSGLPIVARDWRRDVMPIRNDLGALEFEKMPEGILLSYAGFRTWYDGLPLVAIVPPEGPPTVHNLAGWYRRRHVVPDGLKTAEAALAGSIAELTRQGRLKRSYA